MKTGVPYLKKEAIEDAAALLLSDYGKATGPPIPVDEIIELHLKLTVEFRDMLKLLGGGDVHGALWVNDNLIGVDVGLDPDKFPRRRGRYHFTLAHEAGHWRLHRRSSPD